MQDGRTYAPSSLRMARSAVAFSFAVIGLSHGHVYALAEALLDSGADILGVWDEDPDKVADFIRAFPQARFRDFREILSDTSLDMIVNCVRPDARAAMTVRALGAGKHVFSDKPGFLSLEESDAIEKAMKDSGLNYYIYFSEAFHSPGCILAQRLIDEGRLGKVLHYTAFSPHRLNELTRPSWFFDSRINGDVLLDLGCHLAQQFLSFTHSQDARILMSRLANHCHGDKPNFLDSGEALLEAPDGATGYLQVDWFTPDGLGSWGDCRAFVTGSKASLEIRKYIDVAREAEGDHVYLVDGDGEHLINAASCTQIDFFARAMEDCKSHEHKAIDGLACLRAMRLAARISSAASKK
jgi:predicted dehydrogenase